LFVLLKDVCVSLPSPSILADLFQLNFALVRRCFPHGLRPLGLRSVSVFPQRQLLFYVMNLSAYPFSVSRAVVHFLPGCFTACPPPPKSVAVHNSPFGSHPFSFFYCDPAAPFIDSSSIFLLFSSLPSSLPHLLIYRACSTPLPPPQFKNSQRPLCPRFVFASDHCCPLLQVTCMGQPAFLVEFCDTSTRFDRMPPLRPTLIEIFYFNLSSLSPESPPSCQLPDRAEPVHFVPIVDRPGRCT